MWRSLAVLVVLMLVCGCLVEDSENQYNQDYDRRSFSEKLEDSYTPPPPYIPTCYENLSNEAIKATYKSILSKFVHDFQEDIGNFKILSVTEFDHCNGNRITVHDRHRCLGLNFEFDASHESLDEDRTYYGMMEVDWDGYYEGSEIMRVKGSNPFNVGYVNYDQYKSRDENSIETLTILCNRYNGTIKNECGPEENEFIVSADNMECCIWKKCTNYSRNFSFAVPKSDSSESGLIYDVDCKKLWEETGALALLEESLNAGGSGHIIFDVGYSEDCKTANIEITSIGGLPVNKKLVYHFNDAEKGIHFSID